MHYCCRATPCAGHVLGSTKGTQKTNHTCCTKHTNDGGRHRPRNARQLQYCVAGLAKTRDLGPLLCRKGEPRPCHNSSMNSTYFYNAIVPTRVSRTTDVSRLDKTRTLSVPHTGIQENDQNDSSVKRNPSQELNGTTCTTLPQRFVQNARRSRHTVSDSHQNCSTPLVIMQKKTQHTTYARVIPQPGLD